MSLWKNAIRPYCYLHREASTIILPPDIKMEPLIHVEFEFRLGRASIRGNLG